MAIEVKLSELKALVEEGKKLEDLQEYYNLNAAQVRKLMQAAKLTFRKFHKPAFVLINDETQTETQPTEKEAPVETESNSSESEHVVEMSQESDWSI